MDHDTYAPQANRIETVVAVLDAIDAGCDTAASIGAGIGLSARQGGYYAHAARNLGYTEVDTTTTPAEWSLTATGCTLLDMGADALAAAITDTLLNLPELDVLSDTDGDDALEGQLGQDGYADTTARRRRHTLAAWLDFATSPEDAKREALDSVRRDAATYAPAAAQARAAEKKAAARPAVSYGDPCPRCFVTMSLAGTCDNCD